MIGDRPIDGSSSSSTFGRAISARAHRQHLLLAAGHRAGQLVAALLQAREDAEHTCSMSAAISGLVVADVGAHLQVLGDASCA